MDGGTSTETQQSVSHGRQRLPLGGLKKPFYILAVLKGCLVCIFWHSYIFVYYGSYGWSQIICTNNCIFIDGDSPQKELGRDISRNIVNRWTYSEEPLANDLGGAHRRATRDPWGGISSYNNKAGRKSSPTPFGPSYHPCCSTCRECDEDYCPRAREGNDDDGMSVCPVSWLGA